MQELREYAAQTGHLDPHVVKGHEFDDGGIPSPGYQSLGPSHVPAMGPELDALANPIGYHGVGPGAVTMGITVKEQAVNGEDDRGRRV